MPSSTANLSRSPSPNDDGNAGDNTTGSFSRSHKDKECPFCHQAFTSSSLGRHLDLYIKSKNPKPPDGVHDVDKIRDIRGKITRRQPRGGVRKQEHHSDTSEAGGDSPPPSHATLPTTTPAPPAPIGPSSPHDPPSRSIPSARPALPAHPAPLAPLAAIIPSAPATPTAPAAPIEPRPLQATSAPSIVGKRMLTAEREADPLTPSAWGSPSGALRLPPDPSKLVFGTNWQSTGVITGLPNHSADMERFARPSWCLHEAKLAPIRSKSIEGALLEGDETGKAAQLALREVLDSIEAARHREARPSMWDFDFYGSSFPGLCLKLLPAPRLLFSVHPSSSSDSWPLEPPGEAHLTALHDVIAARGAKIGFAPHSIDVQRAITHADTVYNVFTNQPDYEKQTTWRLETLRALAKSQKRLAEKTAELKLASQQAEFFRQQFERVAALTRPQRSTATTPTSATLPSDARSDMLYAHGLAGGPGPLALSPDASEALDHDPDARAWSYDRLIAKWRGKLRDSSSSSSVPVGNNHSSAVATTQHSQQNGQPPTASRASSATSPSATMRSASPTASALVRGDRDREREVRFLWDDGGRQRPRAGTGGSSSAPPGERGEWVDAAAGAVERVWTLGALERKGGGGGGVLPPFGEGEGFNANGKRARPSSWTEAGRGVGEHG